MNDHAIGFDVFDGGVAEEDKGSAAELNHDFGGALGEALAGAEIERNAGPAPVVDLELEGDEGVGVGLGIDVGFLAIAGELLAVYFAGAVLAANGVREDFLRREGLNRVQNFGLLVADFVGVEGDGRLHGGHGKELEEMVGNHVAEGASGFVEAAAMLDADGFGSGDLNVVDVVAVPERFDDVVGKPENHDVLDGFFAEVVVNAVNLFFGEDFLEVAIELNGGLQVVAKGLFDDDAGPFTVFFLGHSGGAKLLDDGGEKAWGDGEVKEIVAAATVSFVNGFELSLEAFVSFGISEVTGYKIDALDKPVPHLQVDRIGGELRHLGGQRLAEGLSSSPAAGNTDDGEVLRQNIFLREVEQGREQLALGQVSGGAEDDHGTGGGGTGSLGMIGIH